MNVAIVRISFIEGYIFVFFDFRMLVTRKALIIFQAYIFLQGYKISQVFAYLVFIEKEKSSCGFIGIFFSVDEQYAICNEVDDN